MPDVLVAGAGPTGLMLANWLVKLGVDVMVVDGKEGPTTESRALVVQARSLEVYDQLGLAEQVLGQARRATALAPGFGSRVFGRVALGPAGEGLTAYPWIEILEQSRNEQILYANLRALGGSVRWGSPLESVTESDGGVVASVGGQTVRARYCVGADGANSLVRRALGIGFEGVTNPHLFYVIDATGVAGLVADAINVRPSGNEFVIAFPMRGRHNFRLIGLVGSPSFALPEARDRLRSRFAVTFGDSRWFATYKVHHRVATHFRERTFFLAGDAAHVHSPVGGQGMNTGLQDAHNLAFKLADVLRGRATDRWLDRYEHERRPVAEVLVGTTDRIFAAVTSQRPWWRAARRVAVPLIGPAALRLAPRSRLFEYVSQIRIRYPGGGRRLPWTGGNHEVLRDNQWQIHGYGAPAVPFPLPYHSFPAHDRFRPDLLYLVRADGFVAAAAPPATAAEEFRAVMTGLGLVVP